MALPIQGFHPRCLPSAGGRQSQILGAPSLRAPAFKFQDKSQPCCRSQKACRHSFFGNGHPGSRRTSTIVAAADYYQTLGVDRGADKKAIKSAYRQLARKFHPDVNKESGAEDKFKEISNAYEVLTDDNKRSIYDRYGEEGLRGSGGFGGMGGFDTGGFQNPFDIFEQFFNGGGFGAESSRSRATQGSDERADLLLEFNEAVFGTSKEVEVSRLEKCGTCRGDGVKEGTRPSTCTTCGGSGQLIQPVRTPLGNFQQVIQCADCDGKGERFTPCGVCGGDGRVRKSKRIQLNVPAGVDTDSRLRVRNEGNAGRKGGPAGDLYVFIRVKKHPSLRREGTTIHAHCQVPYYDAILGTTVQVPTVDGPVDLKIPPGTAPGTRLMMAKRGVPKLNNKDMRGHQEVLVEVTIPSPQKMNGEEKRLVEELRELTTTKPKSKWFG